MSVAVPNKVDMSLDDIIKLSKAQKRLQAHVGQRRGRIGGISVGQDRGQGKGAHQRRGRGARQIVNPVKQLHTVLQSGRGRGRGRGVKRGNSNVSPLNRITAVQQNVQGRGRVRNRGRGGRSAGLQRKQLVFTNSSIIQQSGQQLSFAQLQTQQQAQRLDKVRQQAALLREKKLAIKNLQQAQMNVQTINLALQKTSREKVVNQLRGISDTQTAPSGARGRGRRKLLASLTRPASNISLSNMTPARQLTDTSVTIANPSARRRRRWRRNNKSQISSEHFTIHVANQNLQPVRQQNSIVNQLKMLKPAVSTTYKFQKSVFATSATGVSLSDRFSGASYDGGDALPEGRKVFI